PFAQRLDTRLQRSRARQSGRWRLARAQGRRRLRSVCRRHDHAARRRQGGARRAALVRIASRRAVCDTARCAGRSIMTASTHVYAKIARDGLWTNNPGFVQLLGLCPLLATSNNVVNGFTLGMATVLVLVMSNLIVSLIRPVTRQEIRIPTYVMVIAALVTIVELLMNAYFNALYNILGIFLPIITTNCIIIARAE